MDMVNLYEGVWAQGEIGIPGPSLFGMMELLE